MTDTPVVPDEPGRAAHDSHRVVPAAVSGPLYAALAVALGSGAVLDVGAGSGVVARGLADAGAAVVLTDVVDWRGPVAAGLPFVLGDAARLPFADRACTGVHVARVLHHVPDWRAVLTDAVRVLAPDGVLCLSLGDRPVVDALRPCVDAAVAVAERRGLRQAEVHGPSQDAADEWLTGRGVVAAAALEFRADVAVSPREVLTSTLGNPFRWVAGTDLAAVPSIVAEVLAAAVVDPDVPVPRDRTVRYRLYRRPAGR